MMDTEDREDWRFELTVPHGSHPRALYKRLRGQLSDQVVLTHDGLTFFLYAESRRILEEARTLLQPVLSAFDPVPQLVEARWDSYREEWVPAGDQEGALPVLEDGGGAGDGAGEGAGTGGEEPPEREEDVACVIGKLIRSDFEQRMVAVAGELGLSCTVSEHPHLLSTQAAFHLHGSPAAIADFKRELRRDARQTIRVSEAMIVPYAAP